MIEALLQVLEAVLYTVIAYSIIGVTVVKFVEFFQKDNVERQDNLQVREAVE